MCRGSGLPNPPFLRGIYFTSSLTEGSALDAELAEVLGVPVDSLPEGRVWRRDRAYFLRDLFVEKVFREKGLVTRASNADKQMRQMRQAMIMSVGFIAMIVLGILTWFGSRSLENSIGPHRDAWVAVADFDPKQMQIIDSKNQYYGDPVIPVGTTKTSVAGFFTSTLALVQAKIDIPAIFKPMTVLDRGYDTERPAAYRCYLRRRFSSRCLTPWRTHIGPSWGIHGRRRRRALAQLMKLEYANATHSLPPGDHPTVLLDPLFHAFLPCGLPKIPAGRRGASRMTSQAFRSRRMPGEGTH